MTDSPTLRLPLPAEDDFAEYVGNLLRTGLRGLIPSMDHHDGRMQITVRP